MTGDAILTARASGMRLLILGGTLFIGRRIALELLARGRRRDGRPPGRTEPAELSGCESELPSP